VDNIWQRQEAKSKLSELVDQALKQGAQVVTRRGKKTVVVIPFDAYKRLTKGNVTLVEFLLASPIAGSGLKIARDKSKPRDVEIEL
jgi:prevent-host-death family protein